jgi:alginate O-acetyltransferase complex protein AlgI
MLFNSYEFLLVYLPASLLICSLVDGHPQLRTWVLVVLSLIFYGYWDVRFLPLMVGSILLNWGLAKLYAATKWHTIIIGAIALDLAVLGVFKYNNFFAGIFAGVFSIVPPHFQIALPLGISFFTFHHIMYLVDLGRGKAPVYPFDLYALYICFFPQAIAGPIARWNEVINQFGQQVFRPGWEQRFARGIVLMVIGLFEKIVIADPLGTAIDPIYLQALRGPVTDGQSWMALAWAFQVFFDFAAYSDIAIGVALMFGITLPLNFDGPFRADGIQEFWRRWHMTLTRFLRDYVYIPLGGNRHGATRQITAIVFTMALCGLWHTASWHTVLWGALQGMALAVAVTWKRLQLPSPPAGVGWAAAVGFFILTIVIFRAGSPGAAWRIYQGLASAPGWHPEGRNVLIEAIILAIILPPSHRIAELLNRIPRRVVAVGVALTAVAMLLLIGDHDYREFIYFQF